MEHRISLLPYKAVDSVKASAARLKHPINSDVVSHLLENKHRAESIHIEFVLTSAGNAHCAATQNPRVKKSTNVDLRPVLVLHLQGSVSKKKWDKDVVTILGKLADTVTAQKAIM
ncbi:hypothetical protein Y032_0063g3441 [Ancylostoma ceylanicum]|uniref:Uncharacterized protein n=1 Tax=Ancylostoma ceylanicum TaxID=53326 RepID=A0A016U238_9BILA|nr:hypothetical protein Y032_0063g3441 [Ancylostoma ceylanicum]